MTMFRRILCILLALSLTLACTGAALAEPVDDIIEMEFTTYPKATPTAAPSATPTAAPTSGPSASPDASATPAPTASPEASATPAPTATPIALLSVGSRGTEVAELQSQLTVLGFSCDAADGIYGERTYEAVSRLQSYLVLLNSRGLVSYTRLSTGVADSALLALVKSGVPTYYSTLSYGSTGTQVTRLQYRLSALDYMLANGIDGVFGMTTQAALKDFQATNGLAATGVADKDTQELLFSTLAKKCTDPNARYPYKLIVDVSEQRVYVYEYSN
ncbi:MAG: peptidoglycan-binding protein, partial [Candidatus Fimadaptatus sp.]